MQGGNPIGAGQENARVSLAVVSRTLGQHLDGALVGHADAEAGRSTLVGAEVVLQGVENRGYQIGCGQDS